MSEVPVSGERGGGAVSYERGTHAVTVLLIRHTGEGAALHGAAERGRTGGGAPDQRAPPAVFSIGTHAARARRLLQGFLAPKKPPPPLRPL